MVDSGPPPAAYGGKGPAVRRVTSYVSWVQNAAIIITVNPIYTCER